LDEINPKIMGMSLNTTPTRDATKRTINLSHNAQLSKVVTGEFVAEWRTLGLFQTRLRLGKATLTMASYSPGEQDFAGTEITLKSLASANNRQLVDLQVSDVPTEIVRIPMIYNAITGGTA
jgi:hypothetical protein